MRELGISIKDFDLIRWKSSKSISSRQQMIEKTECQWKGVKIRYLFGRWNKNGLGLGIVRMSSKIRYMVMKADNASDSQLAPFGVPWCFKPTEPTELPVSCRFRKGETEYKHAISVDDFVRLLQFSQISPEIQVMLLRFRILITGIFG